MPEVRFTAKAVEDIANLDGSVQPRVLKKILLLEQNAEAGQPLGKKGGTQLTTLRKLVVGNRDWRIVYRIEPSGDVVVIWVVADRDDSEAYELAARRLNEMAKPETFGTAAIAARFTRRSRRILEEE